MMNYLEKKNLNPIRISLVDPLMITAHYFSCGVIIIGDNFGSIRVYHQYDGSLWNTLSNEKKPDLQSADNFNLSRRINHIFRMDRLVWTCSQDGHLNSYDFCRSSSSPILNLQIKEKAIKSILFDWDRGCVISKVQKEEEGTASKKKVIVPDILVWYPNITGFKEMIKV